MVRPDTVLRSIKESIKESGRLPDTTTYSIYEVDTEGGQSNLRPPIVEITATDVARSVEHNTEFAEFATDNAGNHIGRIYEGWFEMPFQIDLWTAEGDKYDPYEMGESVRLALYQYDDNHRGDRLPDPDDTSNPIDGVTTFVVGDGGVRNDLSMTPALRRWRQTGEVWFNEIVNTAVEYGAEDYVSTVQYPDSTQSVEPDPEIRLVPSGE